MLARARGPLKIAENSEKRLFQHNRPSAAARDFSPLPPFNRGRSPYWPFNRSHRLFSPQPRLCSGCSPSEQMTEGYCPYSEFRRNRFSERPLLCSLPPFNHPASRRRAGLRCGRRWNRRVTVLSGIRQPSPHRRSGSISASPGRRNQDKPSLVVVTLVSVARKVAASGSVPGYSCVGRAIRETLWRHRGLLGAKSTN